jgi:hypothetical protein
MEISPFPPLIGRKGGDQPIPALERNIALEWNIALK